MSCYVDADHAREIVRDHYKSPKWKNKVDKMSDRQVYAIFFSMCERVGKSHVDGFVQGFKNTTDETHKKIPAPLNMSMFSVIYKDVLYKVYGITNDSYQICVDGDWEYVPKELCEVV